MSDITHKIFQANISHNKDFIKSNTSSEPVSENNKTQLSIEEITLITLFNKHCNSVDYSPEPVSAPYKGLAPKQVTNLQKIKTNNERQPEVHFNILAIIALESVTFLMDYKYPLAIMVLDEKVINLDKFLICNDFDDWRYSCEKFCHIIFSFLMSEFDYIWYLLGPDFR